jgi:hypothetical protein
MKKLLYIGWCAYLGLTAANNSAYAQKSSARATIQPAEILIGDHAAVTLEVIAPKGRVITFPDYQPYDTLITGIEIVSVLPRDTAIADAVMTLKQQYIVTSFDSTLYHIPFMQVVDGRDTIRTNDFGLKVTSPELHESVLAYIDRLNMHQTDSIDFAQLSLADIKDNLKPPFVWQDYLSYLWIALLILLLLALIGVGLYFALRKKTKGYFFKPQAVLPPHVVALKELEKIKEEKIWQQGLEKQFYTQITDVLRKYIEKRFYINAFEKTSNEIIETVQIYSEADSSIDNLTQVLKLADLVKFAKYKPLPNENDLCLVNSFLFVNQTKIELPPENEQEESGEESGEWFEEQNIKEFVDDKKTINGI